MRVAYLSEEDSSSRQSWSGIAYSVRAAMIDCGVHLIPLTPERKTHTRCAGLAGLFKKRLTHAIGESYELSSLQSLGASSRELISKAGKTAPVDFVLSIHPDPIAYAQLTIPCGFIGDCNFALLSQTYPDFARQSPAVQIQGECMWRQGLEVSRFAVLASDWAASDTRKRYPELAEKVRVLPFGANVKSGWCQQEIERRVAERKLKPLRLLTVGSDWERKRMNDVIGVVIEAKRLGLDVVLDIVGCTPPEGAAIPEGVTVHGRLDRANHEKNRQLEHLYESAHVFLLASQAECFGIVFGEAASYGLPSVGVASCGITTAVRDGYTGRLLGATDWCISAASELKHWVENPEYYQCLSLGAGKDSSDRLDWKIHARKIIECINEYT